MSVLKENERRLAGIEAELSVIPGDPRNTVKFDWATVEFLARLARDRGTAMSHVTKVAAAAYKQLQNSNLCIYPHVNDAMRLLDEIKAYDVLEGFGEQQRRDFESVRLTAYRAGQAAAALNYDRADRALAVLRDCISRLTAEAQSLEINRR